MFDWGVNRIKNMFTIVTLADNRRQDAENARISVDFVYQSIFVNVSPPQAKIDFEMNVISLRY